MDIIWYVAAFVVLLACLFAFYIWAYEKGYSNAFRGSGILTGEAAIDFEKQMKDNEKTGLP